MFFFFFFFLISVLYLNKTTRILPLSLILSQFPLLSQRSVLYTLQRYIYIHLKTVFIQSYTYLYSLKYFTPGVIFLSVLCFITWLIRCNSWEYAVTNDVTDVTVFQKLHILELNKRSQTVCSKHVTKHILCHKTYFMSQNIFCQTFSY